VFYPNGNKFVLTFEVPQNYILFMSTHELFISWAVDGGTPSAPPLWVFERRKIYLNIRFWWESQKEKRPLGRPIHRGRIILKWILTRDRMGWYGMDWIDLAQDRDRWRALVNTVMNLRVP
jgi:hypothetical protein